MTEEQADYVVSIHKGADVRAHPIFQHTSGELRISFDRILVELTGNINDALFLSQLSYWIPRTRTPEGWVYKSYKDWNLEIGLTRHQVDGVRNRLQRFSWFHTKKQGAGGKPTIHYRIEPDGFADDYNHAAVTFAENRQMLTFAEKRQLHLPKTGKSNTDSTAKTTKTPLSACVHARAPAPVPAHARTREANKISQEDLYQEPEATSAPDAQPAPEARKVALGVFAPPPVPEPPPSKAAPEELAPGLGYRARNPHQATTFVSRAAEHGLSSKEAVALCNEVLAVAGLLEIVNRDLAGADRYLADAQDVTVSLISAGARQPKHIRKVEVAVRERYNRPDMDVELGHMRKEAGRIMNKYSKQGPKQRLVIGDDGVARYEPITEGN